MIHQKYLSNDVICEFVHVTVLSPEAKIYIIDVDATVTGSNART